MKVNKLVHPVERIYSQLSSVSYQTVIHLHPLLARPLFAQCEIQTYNFPLQRDAHSQSTTTFEAKT